METETRMSGKRRFIRSLLIAPILAGVALTTSPLTRIAYATATRDPTVIADMIRPSSDSGAGVQIQNAGGTVTLLDFDTLNNRIGIGTTSPARPIDVVQAAAEPDATPRAAISWNFAKRGIDNARILGFSTGPAQYGLVVGDNVPSNVGTTGVPTVALTGNIVNAGIGDAVGILGQAGAIGNGSNVFAGWLVVEAAPNVTNVKLNGLEIDLFADPTAQITGGVGLSIIAINRNYPVGALDVGGSGSGTFQAGVRVGEITDVAFGITNFNGSGPVICNTGLDLSQGLFNTAAVLLPNNMPIKAKGTSGNVAQLLWLGGDNRTYIAGPNGGVYQSSLGTHAQFSNPLWLSARNLHGLLHERKRTDRHRNLIP